MLNTASLIAVSILPLNLPTFRAQRSSAVNAGTRGPEGFAMCNNRRMGDLGTDFGAPGAGQKFWATNPKSLLTRLGAAGRAFYEPRSTVPQSSPLSPRKAGRYVKLMDRAGDKVNKKMVAAVKKMQQDSTAVMNNIKQAPANIMNRLKAASNGVMNMAQSREGYVASNLNCTMSLSGCHKVPAEDDYPVQYQPQQTAQELANSPFHLAQNNVIQTNPLAAMGNGAVEGYSRHSSFGGGEIANALESGTNIVSGIIQQNGQPASGAEFRNSLAHNVTQTGKQGSWATRTGSNYTTPISASGGAACASQWGRFSNEPCMRSPKTTASASNKNTASLGVAPATGPSTPPQSTSTSTKAPAGAASFALKKKKASLGTEFYDQSQKLPCRNPTLYTGLSKRSNSTPRMIMTGQI